MRSRTTVAQNMKRLRKKRGLTQSELAEGAGLARPYLSKLESATVNVSLDNLDKLADVLNTETWKLVKKSATPGVLTTKRRSAREKTKILNRLRKRKREPRQTKIP